VGICKLCLKERRLVLSHFMPKAAYRSLRSVIMKNANPTMVTKDAMVRTSYQMADYVLCEECEARFDRLGERWVLPRIASKTVFPLLDAVRKAPIDQEIPGAASHACSGIPEINVEKLTYFAMSIFWRAAVHDWKGMVSNIELGPYLERIRLWLLDREPFPRDMSLLVTLAAENKNVFTIIPPLQMQATPYHVFLFYVPGVEFVLYVGKEVVPTIKKFCVFTMPDHPIGISTGVAVRLETMLNKFVGGGTGMAKLGKWLDREEKFANGRRLVRQRQR